MKRVFIILCVICCISSIVSAEEKPILVIDPHGHSAVIRNVRFTPDGKRLISVSNDKTIRLWDVETGDLIKTLRGQIGDGAEGMLNAGALSPDGNTIAVGGYGSGRADYIQLFNLATGEQIGLLTGHTDVITDLAFSQDGNWLTSSSYDNTVRIWDVSCTANVPVCEEVASEMLVVLEGHSDDVYGVAFAPDGKKLVSASFDGTLRLWGLPKDFQKHIKSKVMKKHSAAVVCVAFAPNGKYIVSGGFDHNILLWNSNGKFLKKIDQVSANIDTVSFSADSKKVVSGTGENISIYSIPSGKKRTTFKRHDNTVLASAFYGNDLIATAGGNDYDIYLWDAASGRVKIHIVGKGKRVWAVAFRQTQGEGLDVAFGNTMFFSDDSRMSWNKRGPLERSFDFSEMSLNQYSPVESEFRRTQTEGGAKRWKKFHSTNYVLPMAEQLKITLILTNGL